MPVIRKKVDIINKLGLHARAAAKLVGVTTTFQSQVRIGNPDKMVDGKSIMAIMMLAAGKGTTLELELDGKDAKDAAQAIITLIENRFDEDE